MKREEKLGAHHRLDHTRRHLEISRTPRSRGKFRTWWADAFYAPAVSTSVRSSPGCRTSELTLFPTDSVAFGVWALRIRRQVSVLSALQAASGSWRVAR